MCASGDDDDSMYRFVEDDLVRSLPLASLFQIGGPLGSDLPNNWIVLATKLGLSNEEIERIRRLPNRGYEVLRVWQTRHKTTVRVLRNVLTAMKRHDVVEELDRARQDPVVVTLVIRYQSETKSEALREVPYKRILLDCVRPLIHSNFWTVLRGKVQAQLCLPIGSSLGWTSFVGEFRGQQIEVKLLHLEKIKRRCLTECPVQRRHMETTRCCLSYLHNETLFFERRTENPEDEDGDDEVEADPPSESFRPESPTIEFENPTRGPPSSTSTSPPPTHSERATNNRIPEMLTSLPGYHPRIPVDGLRRAMAAEILKPYMDVDGVYILRPPALPNSLLTVSAVFRGEILHFSIMKRAASGDQDVFYIYHKDCTFESVSDLIEYYRVNGLSLPQPSLEKLYLTKPIHQQ